MKKFSQFIDEGLKSLPNKDFFRELDFIRDDDGYDTISTSLDDVMKQHGFKLIGSGTFAKVYGNPKYSWMLKFFPHNADRAYAEWVKFCQQNQHNPFLPIFKGKIVSFNEEASAIRLEKLIPCDFNQSDELHEALYALHAPKSGVYHFPEKWEKYRADLQKVSDFILRGKFISDLGGSNFMERLNGQVVITDPIAGT